VLHSLSLLFSCLLFSFMAWNQFVDAPDVMKAQAKVAAWLGLQGPWSLLPLLLCVAALLAWLLTAGVVAICRRCIPQGASALSIYGWAFLCALVLPLLAATLVERALVPVEALANHPSVLLRTLTAMASGAASFQSLIVVCALATWPERRERAPASSRRVAGARGIVLLATAALAVLLGLYFGPDTLPFFQKRQLGGEHLLEGSVWAPRDADYFTLVSPPGGPVVLSVHGTEGSTTRLLIDGQEMSSEALLVSTMPRVVAAVAYSPVEGSRPEAPGAAPGRTPYRYRLRRETLSVGTHPALSEEQWVISALQLEPVGYGGETPLLWRARLEGKLRPGQRLPSRGVLLHPVMIDVPQLGQKACLGISTRPLEDEGYEETSVLTNREGSAFVPAPGSQAGRFADDIRLEPREDGHWSITLIVTELREPWPVQCGSSLAQFLSLEGDGARSTSPTLTVALRLD
jgi:hypothetical protein